MNFLKGKVTNNSIKKDIKKIILLTVVLLFLLCACIYFFMQNIIISNANEYMGITKLNIENRLKDTYNKLENLMIIMSEDETVHKIFDEKIYIDNKDISDLKKQIARNIVLEPDIVDIALINQKVQYSTFYLKEELEELSSSMRGKSFQWLGVKKSTFTALGGMEPVFVYGISAMRDGELLGTMVVSIKSSSFFEATDNIPFSYFLADYDFFYAFNNSETEGELKEIWQEEIKGEYSLRKIKDYYISSLYMDKMDCYLISANYLKGNYSSENIILLQIMIWSCIALVIIFVVFFLSIVNNKVIKPLQLFNNSIKEIRSKKTRHASKEVEFFGCKEIQEIDVEFRGMISDIDALNKKIFDNTIVMYELELKKQEAELSYLRSQVDPHFLYNTLEVLRKQALTRNVTELAQMAVDMGNIFRYSSKGEAMVLLREELQIVRSYVRIQENRFENRIKVFYMISESIGDFYVVKMLLQPIVENAIYHGLEPKTGKGSIYIGAREELKCLIITIKDDGVGIEKKRLEKMQENLQGNAYDTRECVGLLNTHGRIQLMFGKDYGIKIESKEEDGTSVFIKLPILKEI
ncbi:MAG: sensor histidine kinase [Lachnospirales bacterium]